LLLHLAIRIPLQTNVTVHCAEPREAAAEVDATTEPLLLRASRGEEVERPVWMMRQAGRHMKRRSTRGGGASRCSLAEQKTVVSIEWRDIDNVSESFLDGISSEIYSNNNNASSPTAAAAAAATAVDKIVGEVDDSKFLSSMTQVSASCPTKP
jgi:hypothetical protein